MTPKQTAFVAEYLIDLNASAAARRAGYSAHRADQQGLENLRKPDISSAIAAAQAKRAERMQVDADWVLKRLHGEATADLADIYDDAGNLRPMREWPMVFRTGLVVGVESVQERIGSGEDAGAVQVRKIKLLDRSKTVELLGKHIDVGAFRDRVEHSGTVELTRPFAGLSLEAIRDGLEKLGIKP